MEFLQALVNLEGWLVGEKRKTLYHLPSLHVWVYISALDSIGLKVVIYEIQFHIWPLEIVGVDVY